MPDTTITFGEDDYNDPPLGDMEGMEESGVYDTSFDIPTLENINEEEKEAPPFTTSTKPKDIQNKEDIDKLVDQKIKEATKKNTEAAKAEQKRLKKEMTRTTAQKRRDATRQFRKDKAAAAARRKQIRQDAVSMRVQAYSVSAALGLPGYIGASIFDQFVLRPREEQQLANEESYEQQYIDYESAVQDQLIAEREAKEDFIEQIKPNVPNRANIKRQLTQNLLKGKEYEPKGSGFTAPKNSPFQKSGADKGKSSVALVNEKLEELAQQNNAGGTPTPSLPPAPTPGSQAPGTQPSPTPTPSTPPAPTPPGGQGGGVPPTPPGGGGTTPPGGPTPPAVPPTPQPSGVGLPLLAAAAIVKGSQVVNQGIETVGQSVRDYNSAMLGDNPIAYGRSRLKLSEKIMDPLGANIPLKVITEGMDSLLSLTEDIRNSAMKDLQFSPAALTASVEGSIEKLMKSIEIGQRLDPVKQGIIEVWTEFELLFMEMKTYFLETFGPFIIAILRDIAALLKAAAYVAEAAPAMTTDRMVAGIGGPVGVFLNEIRRYLMGIEENTGKDKKGNIPDSLSQEIQNFMNPVKQAAAMKQAFNFPNVVW